MRLGVCSATLGMLVSFGAGLCARPAAAGQNSAATAPKSSTATYDIKRETILQGTVVTFVANSGRAPFGAHAVVETSSGQVDVDLGDARLFESKQVSLKAGDALRITGENLAFGSGTQFVARVVQKGEQTVAVRSVRGFPVKPLSKPAGGTL